MIVKKNNQYAVECQTKLDTDCIQNGEYCDSEAEAQEWVESECWIFSGDGWICNKCHDQFMSKLKKHRKVKGNWLDGVDNDLEGFDRLDSDLETGLDSVR